MELLSAQWKVVARILAAMEKKNVSRHRLASRLNWYPGYLDLRLGLMVPTEPGGRWPLTKDEAEDIARALRVPVDELVTDPAAELVARLEPVA